MLRGGECEKDCNMMTTSRLKKKPSPKTRNAFPYFAEVDTRWRDNDRYGHLNNAIYYELFDSAINGFLLENNLLNFESDGYLFLVASSGCNFFSEVAYPQKLQVGIAISRLGNTSITYDLSLFKESANEASAGGFFVHVCVERDSYRPSPILDSVRATLLDLVVAN